MNPRPISYMLRVESDWRRVRGDETGETFEGPEAASAGERALQVELRGIVDTAVVVVPYRVGRK